MKSSICSLSEFRSFLNKNYFTAGGVINVDYAIYYDLDSKKLEEVVQASSNYIMPGNYIKLFHLSNYESAFSDGTDLVAEESYDCVFENLGIESPEISKDDWDSLNYEKKIEYIENNNIDTQDYDNFMRDEAIANICDEAQEYLDGCCVDDDCYKYIDENEMES